MRNFFLNLSFAETALRMIKNQSLLHPALPFSLNSDPITRHWWMSGLFLLAVLLILIPAYYFDPRLLNGAPIWAKPIKFSLSLGMHFFTLALLAQQLDTKHRNGILLRVFGYAAVASMLLEQIYISVQAGRGRHSHFNLETAFESSMFGYMGIAAALLVLISLILGLMIWKYGKRQTSTQGLYLGSVIGLVAGSLLTALLAGYMSAGVSPLIGEALNQTKGVPLLGWSRSQGDLRVSHFLATHLMQILPLIGWLCDHDQLPARKIVLWASLVLILICFLVFFIALTGQPIFI